MAARPHHRLALAVTTVLVVLTAAPGAAAAAPPDPALLEAVTEQVEDELYSKVVYDVHRGEEVVAPIGVISVQKAPVRGLVAQVEAYGDVEFTHRYSNCWYTTGPDGPMAWCEFDATLPGYGGLTLATTMLTVKRDAVPERIWGIPFRWQSKSWADARGGLRKTIDFFKSPGAAVTRGTEGKVGLQNRALPMADIRANGNSALLKLVDGPAPSPSPTPSASSSPTPPATATASPSPTGGTAGADGGEGGGLPVTGGSTAVVAGAGVALLLGGLAAVLATRRRRGLS
ncbi:hypothetical protein [Actinoplanes sp. NPDC049599]|uniref:hypothetical protein n=1 Tax=Actinoplanes sp. NPDC049599 TaxID=3363903 RepID=UPI00379DFC7D